MGADPRSAAARGSRQGVKVAGVICLGNVVYDVLVRPVEALRWNTTWWVEAARHTMGGNGSNTAYTLAMLGARVRLLAWVGDDAAGEILVNKLAKAGVDTRWIRRGGSHTATTVSLVNSGGDRYLLHAPGVSREAFPEPPALDAELLEDMSHLLLANMFAIPQLRRYGAAILEQAQRAGLVTALDTGWDQEERWMEDLGPALRWTDLLFVNEDEARGLTGRGDWQGAATRFRECGVRTVIFKLGAKGAAVCEGDRLVHVPAFEVTAVDTTGAGDCFVGAFLAAVLRGLPAVEAARVANAAAALTVQELGSTEGLRNWEEIQAWMQRAPVRGRS